MQEFLSALSKNQKSLFTKCIDNPIKFKNTIESRFKDKIDVFNNIEIPSLSVSEKIYKISNNIIYTPKCICGKELIFDGNNNSYKIYCSKHCARKHVTPGKVSFIVDGVTYNSLTSAIKETGLSRWSIYSKLLDNSAEWTQNQEENITSLKNKILSEHIKLKDREFLIKWKEEGKSSAELSKELNISQSTITLAFKIHNINNSFGQIPKHINEILYSTGYLEEQIKTKSSEQIAKELNISPTSVLIALHSQNISWESKRWSIGEKEVLEYIKSILPNDIEILENVKGIIKFQKELDIYIPSLKVAIEYNGIFWHKDKPKIHQQKMNLCRDEGIRLIQIWDIDWNNKQDLIKKKLDNIFQLANSKIFARNTIAKRISNIDSRIFLNNNHIYGYKPAKDVFGLYYKDELVSVMSFSRGHLERFATSISVVGGFSKLFALAKTEMNFREIITYADLCWSDLDKNVYITNGFVLDKVNGPNHFWVKGNNKYSRQKFQKNKLKAFSNYVESKSASVIMKENGYHQIFDAGHAKFIWNNREESPIKGLYKD